MNEKNPQCDDSSSHADNPLSWGHPDYIKKQFIELGGIPVVEWSLRAFFASDAIDEIILVAAAEDVAYCERSFYRLAGSKRFCVVAGGAERRASVEAGAIATGAGCDVVAVHDGARPFVDARAIRAGVEAARRTGAACVAVRATDTIKIVDGAYVAGTPDRAALWAAQTPQAFRRGLLLDALARARRDGYVATDDASLVERLGARVEIVEGSYDNIKITTPTDLAIARGIAARVRPARP